MTLLDRFFSSLDLIIRVSTLIFLVTPAIVVIFLSFSNSSSLTFPPSSFGLQQYRSFFESDYWLGAVVRSFQIAIPVAILTIALGLSGLFVIYRSRLKGRGVIQVISVSPLILPGVAYALALYTLFIGFDMVGSIPAVILTHIALALPFVVLIVGASLSRLPIELELVAMSLGASRLRALFGITLRLNLPAVGASFIFAFITSFDEAIFINFIGGTATTTLPKAIYDNVKTGVDPTITAIASILMLGTAVVMGVGYVLRFRGSTSR